jgi:Acetyltransferase (GNAT) domain
VTSFDDAAQRADTSALGPMQVAEIADRASWNNLLREAAGATFFHTIDWGEAASRSFGWKCRPCLVSSAAGSAWVCLVFETNRGLEAGPVGYGGFLPLGATDASASISGAMRAVEAACGGTPFIRIVGSPLGRRLESPLDLGMRPRSTSVVHMPTTWQEMWDDVVVGSARTAVRRSTDQGVETYFVDCAADIDALYPLYDESMSRVGATYRTPPFLLQELVSLGQDRVWMIAARKDGVTLAWSMFLRFEATLFHWISVYCDGARPLMANHRILYEMFKLACVKRIGVVDMGASHTDGQRFAKSRWGAELREYDVFDAAFTS